MNMLIDDNRRISELQEEFNNLYPFLKIEFLKHPYSSAPHNLKKDTYPNHTMLRDCRKNHNSGVIELADTMKVSEFEKILSESYGLYAQVFRHSGNIWLITTATDGWTLKTQNDEGRELSEPKHNNPREEVDYHEQD